MTTTVFRFGEPVPYATASRLQEALVARRISDQVPDVILLLEHTPVVTSGRRLRDRHFLASPDALSARGIDFAVSSRGGDATYHGPGQLVLYPILKLAGDLSDTRGYLRKLEQIAIGAATACGVSAFERPGKPGAWTKQGKIAAVGFRLRRWVSQHGMSFNVDPDLSGFSLIVPCGLAGEPVSSLSEILGDACPSVDSVALRMITEMEDVFHRSLRICPIERLDDLNAVDEVLNAIA